MVSVEGAASTTGGGVGSKESSGVEASGSEAGKAGEDGGGVSDTSPLGVSWPQLARSVTVSRAMARIASNLLGISTTPRERFG